MPQNASGYPKMQSIAEVDVAARDLTTLALLGDDMEANKFLAPIARFESRVMKIAEWFTIRRISHDVEPVVEHVRATGNDTFNTLY